MSNEVRHLLILERGRSPLSNFSPKAKGKKWFSYPVISSEARNLLSSIETGNSLPSNFPQKRLKIFWVELEEGTFPSSNDCRPERSEGSPPYLPQKTFYCVVPRALVRGTSAVYFLGGVGGGDFSLLQWLTRVSPPFQLSPKFIKSFLGGVRGGSVHLLQWLRPLKTTFRGDIVGSFRTLFVRNLLRLWGKYHPKQSYM